MYYPRRGNNRNFVPAGEAVVRRSFMREEGDANVWNRLDAEEDQEPDLRFKLLMNSEVDDLPMSQKPKLSERFAELSTGSENKFFDPRDLKVKYLVGNDDPSIIISRSDVTDTLNSGVGRLPPWKGASQIFDPVDSLISDEGLPVQDFYQSNRNRGQTSNYGRSASNMRRNFRGSNGQVPMTTCIDLTDRSQAYSGLNYPNSYYRAPVGSTYSSVYSQPEVVIPRLSRNPLPPRLMPGNRANQAPLRIDAARQALIETRMHRQNANALPSRTILNQGPSTLQTRPNISGPVAQRKAANNQQNAGQNRMLASQKNAAQQPASGRIMISTKKVDGQQNVNRNMVATKRAAPQQNVIPTKRVATQQSVTNVPAKHPVIQAKTVVASNKFESSKPVVGEKRMIPTTRTITTQATKNTQGDTQKPFISDKKSFRAIVLITGALPLYKKDATVIRGVLMKKMAEAKTHDGDPLSILSSSLVLGRLIVECANVGTFNWILNWTMVHRGDEKVVAVNPILAGDPLKIGIQVTKEMREEGVNGIVREINRSNAGMFAEHWRSINEITNENGVLIQFSIQPIIVERIRRLDWKLKFRNQTIKVIDYRTKVQKTFYTRARI